MKLQARIYQWVVDTFSVEVAQDKQERNFRFLEESLELVQAAGFPKEEALNMVDYVYSRPTRDLPQEIAGSMLTLLALAEAHGFDANSVAEQEMIRIEANADSIREKNRFKPR